MMNSKILSVCLIAAACMVLPYAAQAAGWDAISVDEVKGEKDPFYGVGNGDSKEEAEKAAQKFCASAGGKECQLMVSYQQCGAYAAAKQYAGKGTGDSKDVATKKAMDECNDSDCSLVIADCVK